jgi:predicted nuclease with TOPRIM domain
LSSSVKRTKAEKKALIEDHQKLSSRVNDLELKFENLGLSPEITFAECRKIAPIIDNGIILAQEKTQQKKEVQPSVVPPSFKPKKMGL